MRVQIITTDKTLYEGNAKLVQVPGKKGRFEMLNMHAPIISTLSPGTIRLVDNNDQTTTFEVKGGLVENSNNKIIILAET